MTRQARHRPQRHEPDEAADRRLFWKLAAAAMHLQGMNEDDLSSFFGIARKTAHARIEAGIKAWHADPERCVAIIEQTIDIQVELPEHSARAVDALNGIRASTLRTLGQLTEGGETPA